MLQIYIVDVVIILFLLYTALVSYLVIAGFAASLSQRISDKSLVIDFRDCNTLSVLLDQEQLYWTQSPVFRPDLSIVEINVDNVGQVSPHFHQK